MKSSTKKKFTLPSKDGLQINFVFDRHLFGALKHHKAQTHVAKFYCNSKVHRLVFVFLETLKILQGCRREENGG